MKISTRDRSVVVAQSLATTVSAHVQDARGAEPSRYDERTVCAGLALAQRFHAGPRQSGGLDESIPGVAVAVHFLREMIDHPTYLHVRRVEQRLHALLAQVDGRRDGLRNFRAVERAASAQNLEQHRAQTVRYVEGTRVSSSTGPSLSRDEVFADITPAEITARGNVNWKIKEILLIGKTQTPRLYESPARAGGSLE